MGARALELYYILQLHTGTRLLRTEYGSLGVGCTKQQVIFDTRQSEIFQIYNPYMKCVCENDDAG